MRYTCPIFLALLTLCAGCYTVGTTVGVGSTSGIGISYSSHGDFLYSGPSEAYANNKKGLTQFLDKDYATARTTFETTLEKYPTNPDATYYLGLSLIYLDEREAGFNWLRSYRDPIKTRIAQEVTWWANYCAKKSELTPDKIYQVMNKARSEGYRRQQEQDWERRRWRL